MEFNPRGDIISIPKELFLLAQALKQHGHPAGDETVKMLEGHVEGYVP